MLPVSIIGRWNARFASVAWNQWLMPSPTWIAAGFRGARSSASRAIRSFRARGVSAPVGLLGQPLYLEARPVRAQALLVSRQQVCRIQARQRVGPDQDREVGEPFHEIWVVPVLVEHQLRDAEEQGGVRRGAYRDR